jgi:succinyl-CoA synthetase alpha subunit
MPLVLKPSLDDLDREQVEQFVETVRAKRMVATVEYFTTKNEKVKYKQGKIGARIQAQIDMLGKEIDALERAEQKVEARMMAIEQLKHEYEGFEDELVEVEP